MIYKPLDILLRTHKQKHDQAFSIIAQLRNESTPYASRRMASNSNESTPYASLGGWRLIQTKIGIDAADLFSKSPYTRWLVL